MKYAKLPFLLIIRNKSKLFIDLQENRDIGTVFYPGLLRKNLAAMIVLS